MIGLEHICKIFECEYKELAEKMNIAQPTIQDWLKKRRNIPKSRIEQLSEIFKGIPPEYFQKELKKSEELEVQMIYLHQTDTTETVDELITDDYGNEVAWVERSYSVHAGIIDFLNIRQSIEALLERVKVVAEDETARRLIDDLLDTVEFGGKNQIDFLSELFGYLNKEDYLDFTEKYLDLKHYLERNNLIKKSKERGDD